MNRVAENYVRLVLAVGLHDANYVDAYYGPEEFRTQVKTEAWSLADIRSRAKDALAELEQEEDGARKACLGKQLGALVARVDMLNGKRFSFDEESAALYDVVDSGRPDSHYASACAELDALIPGPGTLAERYEKHREQLHIPGNRLEAVFSAATEEARRRTKQYIALAPNETFEIECVKDQVWGAYNWYKGNSHSLIQVNTDLPISIAGIVHLACHEGYPGHHVYNALLESCLSKSLGWVEFTVYPLFSPQSLIAEGTAEYGSGLAFSDEERLEFERQVLYPLAGLDPELADSFSAIRQTVQKLNWASTDSARQYLDGHATRQETIEWLMEYAVATPARAEQRVRFIEANRSYVVTYDVGHELIKQYVETRATTLEDRWTVFTDILSTPKTPTMLKV